MKIVFAGGGTAGHVNPALAVANYISAKEESQVWLSGNRGGIEEKLAKKAGYPIYTFPLKGLARGKSLAALRQDVSRQPGSAKSSCGSCSRTWSWAPAAMPAFPWSGRRPSWG